MPIHIGVPKETFPGEQRVAITSRSCERLQKDGMTVLIESSAGVPSGYSDEDYVSHGAQIRNRVDELYYLDHTLMLFGDAKSFVASLVKELNTSVRAAA